MSVSYVDPPELLETRTAVLKGVKQRQMIVEHGTHGRVYFSMSWKQLSKSRERKLGACWAPNERLWFVPLGTDLEPFKRIGCHF